MPHARSSLSSIASLCLATLALACDTASSGSAAASSTASDTKTTAPAAGSAKTESPAPAPVELVEHDLSSADPEWSGWTAKGPKDAKVMADGVKGARIAANGRDGFDLKFAPKHRDLAEMKSNLEKGAAASEGKMKLTFDKQTADALEWTSDGYGTTTHSFVHLMKVAGRDVTCGNNYMVGIRDAARLQQHKEACLTLTKK